MITYYGATTKGRIREKNEDAFLMLSFECGYPFLFAVADGIGGHNAGEVASHIAVDILEKYFRSGRFSCPCFESVRTAFEEMSKEINASLCEISENDEEKRGLGTTLSILVMFEAKAYISHIGDSAVFRIGDGVWKLTEDHTFVNELLKKNEISETEAKSHPRRNLITRALGCGFDYDMDTAEADVSTGETYILCTDGLFNGEGNHTEIFDPGYMKGRDVREITDHLIGYADSTGGRDNTTIITIRT